MIVPFAFGMPGVPELLILLLIVLLFFGAGKLPAVFKSLGEGLRSFRDAQRDPALDVTPQKELDGEK